MALPPTGYPNESFEILRIETTKFDLYIQGKPYHPTVEKLHLHRHEEDLVDACLEIVDGEVPLQVQSIQFFSPLFGKLVIYGQERTLPLFYENQNYQLVIQQKGEEKVTFHHESVWIRNAVKPLAKTNILTGVINFQNEIGYTEFDIRISGRKALSIRMEIFPSKMDYKRDYQLILQDVNEQIYNLSFDFLRKTYNLTGLRETKNQSLTEFFAILQHVFQHLVNTMDRIKVAPHHRLIKERRIIDAAKVKHAGKENIPFILKRPQLLIKDNQNGMLPVLTEKYLPIKLVESQRRIDYDTNENRFIRWILERITKKLKEIKKRLKEIHRVTNPELIKRIDRMILQMNRFIDIDFLKNVGPMRQMSISLVLQMAPGYRDVYRYYLLLMKGLTIQGDLFKLSMKDVAQLYEYWCFLKIHSLLKKKYELVKQDIIRAHRTGLFVTLDKSKSARVHYRNPRNGETFILYYNSLPTEESKNPPTLSQRPDNVLTLRKVDSNIEYKYVFDAKYRLNPAYEGSSYFNNYRLPGPEEEDINTMHRYRDAIVYQDRYSSEFERSLFGAYVLFPYPDEDLYMEHHFYNSIKKVNVGAFPFLPNSTKLVEDFLDELILDSPEKAYERAVTPRGTMEYFQDRLTGKNVIVGSLGSKEQLDICLKHHFYYIPLNRIIQEQHLLIGLEYIGIYQSKKYFKDSEKGIHWIGKITKWEIVCRREITEIPLRRKNHEELYVRFLISKWTKKKNPIEPGGYGIYTHLFTTKYILDRAKEIAELRLDTEEQIKEWREKRRIGKVHIVLDHENVDQASNVVDVALESLNDNKPDKC